MKRSLLKKSSTSFDIALRFADPALVVASCIVAYRIYLGDWSLPLHYVVAVLAATLLSVLIFPLLGLYQSQRGISLMEELRTLFLGWLLIALAGSVFLFATKTGAEYSRVWAGIWLTGGFVAHALSRAALRAALRAARRRGYNLRHICVVGAGAHGREVAARIRAAPWSGLVVRGFYDDAPELANATVDGLPVLGTVADCARDMAAAALDQVWIALPLRDEEKVRRLVDELRQTSLQVCFVPDIYSFHLLHHSVTEIASMPVLNLTDSPHTGIDSTLKAAEDYVLAAVLLLLTSPLWLLISAGVKLSTPGPVLYRQERVTWNGQRFRMLKFRSMPIGAEAISGPVWARPGELRATRFGALLRRLSLDELPQLLNVLRGEMSLVGPRPERPEFVTQFRKEVPGYMQKHLVKAGMTGWAQVNDLRGSSDLAKRIQCDLYYIENWSLGFDLRILALTLWHVFRSRNAG